jgi:2-polyprenyl-3-methyl-5-hydroxy-6-metoxy-1,4-benzoquinol methylase
MNESGMRIVRCACGMVYVSPVPAAYATGVFYNDAANYYLSPAKLESDYAAVRFARELALFRRHCPGGRLLDVGCSTGGFLFQVQQRFPGAYHVVGTDVSGPPLDYAESQGVPVVRGDFLAHDFGGDQFHAITFWAVLEHLAEPGKFLARAASLLAPGGRCFVLVPNLRSAAVRLLGGKYRYIYPQHLNYVTAATLRQLAGRQFTVVETRTMHFNPAVIWQDWRGGGGEVPNPERAALLRRTTRLKQNRWLAPLRWAYTGVERTLGGLGLADNLAMVLQRRD